MSAVTTAIPVVRRSSCPSTWRQEHGRSTWRIALSAAARTSFMSRLMTMEMRRCGRKGSRMLPLYQDRWVTFRFAEDWIIPRFHLEGVPAGQRVPIFKLEPRTGERLDVLAMPTVGRWRLGGPA